MTAGFFQTHPAAHQRERLTPEPNLLASRVMGLIHPGILLGLLAVALPVAIHFIRSRKYQRVEIGALRFLRVAIQERRRWRRIENWPLLLARIAAVALLTLLFARPFFPDREKIPPGDLEAILLTDASGSVSGAHFEAVRNAVRETLAKIPPGAKITIAPFADEVRPLEGAQLDALHAVPGARTDYTRAVHWTLDHIAQSERKSAHVWLIGDFQSAALPSAPPRLWPANAHASLIRVPPAGAWNAAIAKVELLTPYVADEAEVEVTVVISGDAPAAKREVVFEIEGQPPMKAKAEADGGRVQFRWKPEHAGLVRGSVSIASDDAFPDDNRRPFAAHLAEPKRVLLIEGGTPLTPFEGESYYLEKALGVSGKAHGQSPFATHVQLDLAGLDGAAAVAVCNAALPADAAVKLAEFVQNGGAVAFFLGGNTDLAKLAPLAAARLLPPKISPVGVPVPRAIEAWDKTHPALARFDGADRGDLRGVVLRDAFAIEGGADWQVLASLENGHPALLTRELGKGRVLVFTNPPTRAWSDLPTARIFLPLMKEWFGWLTRLDPEAGTPVEIATGFAETRAPGVYENGAALEIVAPDPAEMDVTVADEATVRRALALPDEKSATPPPENAGLPKFRERQNEIWPWLVLALLALLLLENRLADQRQKRHERAA